MKHIVFVIGYYKNGGVAMRTTNLANELGKKGYKVTILVTKEMGNEIFFKIGENVEIVVLSEYIKKNTDNLVLRQDEYKRSKDIKKYKRLRYLTKFFKSLDQRLEDRIRNLRVSEKVRKYIVLNEGAIYIPFGMSYFEAVICATEGTSCKVIYSERNAPEKELPSDEKKAKRLLNLLKKANGAIFQTKEERKFYGDYAPNNSAVIHNPVKEELPKPYEGKRKNLIVNFCRVSEQKNLKLLVDAFKKINQEYPEYELIVYGNAIEKNEENLKFALIEYVESIGMNNCISIVPAVSDVHNRILDSAMFVSSSDFEGLSNSMIEAMAIGLPCICTDCLGGGAREMINDNINGLLVPMQNVDALYKAMKSFIENPDFAAKCGKEAAKISNELSTENIVKKWINVIENI